MRVIEFIGWVRVELSWVLGDDGMVVWEGLKWEIKDLL